MNTRFSKTYDRYVERIREQELRNARRLPTWRTRQRRRTLTVITLLGSAAMIAGAVIIRADSRWGFLAVWGSGFAVGGLAWMLLRVLTGRMTSTLSVLLDEREREWRHRVTYVGFQVSICLMLITMFYTILISNGPDSTLRAAMMMNAMACLAATVPTLVVAWTLPDDDPDDFDEEEAHA